MRFALSGLCLSLVLVGSAYAQSGAPELGQLHDDLRLTPAQQEAWSAYASVLASVGQAQTRRREATVNLLPRLTTPRRLALIDSAMTEDLADFRRQRDAVTAFYEKLSPEQQRVFDSETQSSGDGQGRGAPEQNGSRPLLRAPPP